MFSTTTMTDTVCSIQHNTAKKRQVCIKELVVLAPMGCSMSEKERDCVVGGMWAVWHQLETRFDLAED